MGYRLGVDVGRTFTDLVQVNDETGAFFRAKTPSTPSDPSQGVLEGLRRICSSSNSNPGELTHILHGTTVATNAVLESKGARVGLLVTEGFREILHLARSQTPGPLAGWIIMVKPDPPASLADTREVSERLDARGNEIRPLDEEQVKAAVRDLVDNGVETLTVSLVNSYANAEHEHKIKAIIHSNRIGFGLRPAILVIDMIQAFTDPSSPLGADLNTVVASLKQLLEVARSKKVPIVFTTVAYDASEHQAASLFITKVPALKVLKSGTKAVETDPRLARQSSEPLLLKQFASSFFGTSLVSLLVAAKCDTVIVTGCTTSGCVRASVVDALQYGFRPIVPLETVGDRAPEPHHANLFDIQAKYGDVVELSEVLIYLETLPGFS